MSKLKQHIFHSAVLLPYFCRTYTFYFTPNISTNNIRNHTHTICFPNEEVRLSMRELLLNVSFGGQDYYTMIQAMTALARGHADRFTDFLKDYIHESLSYFDSDRKEAEKPYQLLLLGMAAFFANTHHVRSERESGKGRYDIGIEPKNKDKKGILIEVKIASAADDLEQAAQEAYHQILGKGYKAEMEARGVKEFVLLGIAFCGKEVAVVSG